MENMEVSAVGPERIGDAGLPFGTTATASTKDL